MTGQIHAHDPDRRLALQALEIVFRGGLRTAQDDLLDLVVAQVAQGGGVAVTAREEVLVEARHRRARRTGTLRHRTAKIVLAITLHGGAADAFALAHPAAVDPIPVIPEDLVTEGLTGALPATRAGL